MTKFCANCGGHHEQRGFFCSTDCRRDFRNRKRQERAGKLCRLCGRRMPKPKELGAVPREHALPEESQSCPVL
jgi:hypothetical protein